MNEILNAIIQLIEVLIKHFGTLGTIGILVFVLLISIGWRLYNDKKNREESEALLEEKDRTIQRLAEQERSYRALFFKKFAGWEEKDIERFILKNEFKNPVEARKFLEDQNKSQESHKNTNSDKGRT